LKCHIHRQYSLQVHRSTIQVPISSRSDSIGGRRKRKYGDVGSEFLQLERMKLKLYDKSIANEESENPDMGFFKVYCST
jgi:hypothetical protein